MFESITIRIIDNIIQNLDKNVYFNNNHEKNILELQHVDWEI